MSERRCGGAEVPEERVCLGILRDNYTDASDNTG